MSHSSAAYNAVMSLYKIGIGAKSKLTLKQQREIFSSFVLGPKKSILYDTSLRRRRPADVGVRSIAMMTDL